MNESKDAVEAGDEATPADGKKKKEKSKKRFLSFRSFSFSKKDKTKPKKEENAADATNGDIEKVPEEVGLGHIAFGGGCLGRVQSRRLRRAWAGINFKASGG